MRHFLCIASGSYSKSMQRCKINKKKLKRKEKGAKTWNYIIKKYHIVCKDEGLWRRLYSSGSTIHPLYETVR